MPCRAAAGYSGMSITESPRKRKFEIEWQVLARTALTEASDELRALKRKVETDTSDGAIILARILPTVSL